MDRRLRRALRPQISRSYFVLAAPTTGYSGTPLVKKLGIKEGCRLLAMGVPQNYLELLDPLPRDVQIVRRVGKGIDVAHVFVTRKSELIRHAKALRQALTADAALWMSWPKKVSKVATDVSEDVIREVALPLGWVDVKVCAIDATWSGLKLVVRKELR